MHQFSSVRVSGAAEVNFDYIDIVANLLSSFYWLFKRLAKHRDSNCACRLWACVNFGFSQIGLLMRATMSKTVQ